MSIKSNLKRLLAPRPISRSLRIIVIPPLRGYFRYFPLHAGKALAWKYIAAHLWWLESRAKASTVFGSILSVDARDTCGRFIYYFGVWEPTLTAWIQGRLRPGDYFIDVGANVGYFSLLGSTLVGQNGKVVAIEAIPRTFEVLTSNLDVNLVCNARAVNMAAWNANEHLTFYISQDTIDGTSTAMPDLAEKWQLSTQCHVAAAPLYSLLSPDEIASARLIKIDVEGAELEILAGLGSILENGRRDLEVVMEISTKSFEKVASFFLSHGFFPYHMENEYSAERYIRNRPARAPERIVAAPKSCTELDVVFSRIDGTSLS